MASASGKSSLALLKAWSAEQLKEGRVEAHLRALLSSLRHLRLVAALLHAGEPVPPFSNLPIFIYLYSTVIRSGGRGGLSQFLLLLDLDARFSSTFSISSLSHALFSTPRLADRRALSRS